MVQSWIILLHQTDSAKPWKLQWNKQIIKKIISNSRRSQNFLIWPKFHLDMAWLAFYAQKLRAFTRKKKSFLPPFKLFTQTHHVRINFFWCVCVCFVPSNLFRLPVSNGPFRQPGPIMAGHIRFGWPDCGGPQIYFVCCGHSNFSNYRKLFAGSFSRRFYDCVSLYECKCVFAIWMRYISTRTDAAARQR